ncbi:MAG: B12-binding domain-containing radical SAM protein, partial [Endomicrobia bacterium]|nr:B12-binding domain-containing radical SAM protein [Endomicrobiia bacterium]
IKKLKNGVVMVFCRIRIHYGTDIYKQALAEGKITKETSLLKPYYYFSDKIDISEMNKMIEQSFKGNRKRIFPPEKGEEMMRTIRKFGCKGLLWDTLVKA